LHLLVGPDSLDVAADAPDQAHRLEWDAVHDYPKQDTDTVAVQVHQRGAAILLDQHDGARVSVGTRSQSPGIPDIDTFRVGDTVTWIGEDEMVPRRSIGRVVKVYRDSGYVLVDFPKGRWAFKPEYLRYAPADVSPKAYAPAPDAGRPPSSASWDGSSPHSSATGSTAVATGAAPAGSQQGNHPDRDMVVKSSIASTGKPVAKSADVGEAVAVPNLGSFDHAPEETKEAHERSVLLAVKGLCIVFFIAFLAALCGYGYLSRVLPPVVKDNPDESQAAADGASETGEYGAPDASAPYGGVPDGGVPPPSAAAGDGGAGGAHGGGEGVAGAELPATPLMAMMGRRRSCRPGSDTPIACPRSRRCPWAH